MGMCVDGNCESCRATREQYTRKLVTGDLTIPDMPLDELPKYLAKGFEKFIRGVDQLIAKRRRERAAAWLQSL
jgi:hypothetical protein